MMARHTLILLAILSMFAVSCAGGKKAQRAAGPLHKACAGGDLEKCHAQAVIIEGGDAGDRRAALTAFQYGCLLKHAPSCNGLARLYGNVDAELSDARVMDALREACDGGEPEACIRIGDRAPRSRAVGYYERACEADNGNGCHKLADEIRRGWMIEDNVVQAAELDEKACELGSAKGCLSAGQAFLFGSGVEKDEGKGLGYLEKACNDKQREGCRVMGLMYEKGIGVTPNSEQAKKYYDLAGPAADIVADSPSSAFVVFVDACNRGNYLGCFDAAWFLAEGVEVERNITTSRELFEKACDGGIQDACERWEKINPSQTRAGGKS